MTLCERNGLDLFFYGFWGLSDWLWRCLIQSTRGIDPGIGKRNKCQLSIELKRFDVNETLLTYPIPRPFALASLLPRLNLFELASQMLIAKVTLVSTGLQTLN